LLLLNPSSRMAERALFWLSALHFGRFGVVIQTLWVLGGLIPAVLAFTGVFICCRRVMYGKPSNPKQATD